MGERPSNNNEVIQKIITAEGNKRRSKPLEVGDLIPFIMDRRAEKQNGPFRIISMERDPNNDNIFIVTLERFAEEKE
jgi:hypothetical protein